MPKEPVIRTEFSYEELVKQLEDNATPAQQEFINAIRKAEDRMAELHKPDQTGRIPLLDENAKQELMALHMQIGKAADNLLPEEENPERKELVEKLNALASANYAHLLSYDPKEPKTLPTLLEDVRTMTVDLRNISLDSTQKGSINSRQPITFMNVDGKPISGLFTPMRKSSHITDFKHMLREQCEKHIKDPKFRQVLENFPDDYIKTIQDTARQSEKPVPTEEEAFVEMLDDMGAGNGSSFTANRLGDFLEKNCKISCPIEENTWDVKLAVVQYIKKKNLDLVAAAEGELAKIPEGSRIDNRNAAMSTLADLLGKPNLVPRARQMKVIDETGKTVEGTFMLRAKGEDVNHPTKKVENLTEEAGKKTNGKGFKDLADLQVLYYLGGNVDPHPGNIFLQFNDDVNLNGAQGIDNDCSFGLLTLENGENVKNLTAPKHMRVVSESMYHTVMGMDPAGLKFALRGYGLSEAELDAAGTRLKNLKTELKKAYEKQVQDNVQPGGKITKDDLDPEGIRIVSDNNFSQFCLDDLTIPKSHDYNPDKNLFDGAKSNFKNLPHNYKFEKKEKAKLQKDIQVIGEKNRALPQNLEKSMETTKELLKQMKDHTVMGWFHWHRGTSPQFENMRNAVQAYHDFQSELQTRIQSAKESNDPDAIRAGAITEEDMKKMAELGKTVQTTATTYLNRKGPKDRISNPYTKDRVTVAEAVKDFGVLAAEIKPEEKEFSQINGRRAEEAYREACAKQGIQPQEKQPLVQPQDAKSIGAK